MTVEIPSEQATSPAPGRSVHVVRARKLLYGGLVGGVAASVLALIGFGLAYGWVGVRSAALASVLVLFFYVVGQYVMVLFADAGARTLLAVAMASYTSRVVVLGLALLLFDRFAGSWPAVLPLAVFVTTIAVVAGWLIVEVLVFLRLRIGVYDAEYNPPSATDGAP